MTVRGKIFAVMAIVVFLVSAAYVGTTQGYLESLFVRYYLDLNPAGVQPEQIEGLQQYIMDRMEMKAVTVTLYIAGVAVVVCFLISGMLVKPLKRLIGVMEKVAEKELDTEIEVIKRDEYGQVGEAFNKMTRNLREAENSRKRLVEDVAHELRTPLAIVLTKLELIQQSPSAVNPETLLPLHDEVLRVIHLVDELQLITSAEAGELTLHREWIDLEDFLIDLAELIEPEAEACGIRLHGPERSGGYQVYIDPRRFKQVILNLVANALQHTPAEGEIYIRISATTDMEYIAVIVRDTGPGIPPDAIPHLFDRFYRVNNTERRRAGGLGLGLAIARQIVLAHGGSIKASNHSLGGAEFAVYIPFEKTRLRSI